MLTEAEDAQLEGAKNLVRFWGRPALCIVAVVAGFFIFTKVDAATDPGPASHTPTYQHVDASYHGQNSNGVPPTFAGNLPTSTTLPDSSHGANSNGVPPFFTPVPLTR